MDGFAERLQSLIGEGSISAFARKVGLSEALIRKYLKGAEPGLARANQIAMGANCSLEWLATGCGYLYRQAEVVDREALGAAQQLLREQQPEAVLPDEGALVICDSRLLSMSYGHKLLDSLPPMHWLDSQSELLRRLEGLAAGRREKEATKASTRTSSCP